MDTVAVGCDINQGNDHEVQDTVCQALEKANYTVEKLDIHPNAFASYDWGENGKNPSGKIGVYIIADGIYSIADRYSNSGGFKYVYFIIRGDLGRPRMQSRSDFENNPIGADPDCKGVCEKLRGKTFPEMNEICKSKCHIVFGTNAQEMASELIKAMGGDTGTSSSSSKSSVSPIRTVIKELLYEWNGDVECYLRDDTIHIRRIPNPTTAKLKLVEDVNVLYEGINVTDIDPKCVNRLIVKWGKYKFEIKDKHRIDRFGEIKKSIKAPNKTEKSAIAFAYREWNKLLKDSGRRLECKVDGDPKWRIGEWVRVYIPSFYLDGYMYITKVNHNDDGDWTCSLTLEDYPPDLGTKPSQKDNSNDNSATSTDTTSTSASAASDTVSDK